MDFLFSTLQLLAALTILVFIHELGHFLAAMWSTTRGGTEYGIGWLPLGGYVKIHGMIDESMDKEHIGKEPGPNEFRSKPAWQRLVVMLGGIVFNIILGIILLTAVFKIYVKEYLPNKAVTTGIYAHALAKEQGFETGDKIVAVNGKAVKRFNDAGGITTMIGSEVDVERGGQMQKVVVKDIPFEEFRRPFFSPNKEQVVTVEEVFEDKNAAKAGILTGDIFKSVNNIPIFNFPHFKELVLENRDTTVNIVVNRGEQQQLTITAKVNEDGLLGFIGKPTPAYNDVYELEPYNLGEALRYSVADGWETVYTNVKGIGRMTKGEESFRDNVMSPIGMIALFPADWDGYRFWRLTAIISFILAFMNLLPIPALDGGHATFLLWEMVTRRKPSEGFLMKAQVVGMVLLLALMVFVMGNDLYKLIFGG